MIEETTIAEKIDHWLKTPQHSVLGSEYGNNLADFLFMPMAKGMANSFIFKLKADLSLSSAQIDIYAIDEGFDKKKIILMVNDNLFNLT